MVSRNRLEFAVGLVGGSLAVSNGFSGPIASAIAAAAGVFAGQVSFSVRNRDHLD